MAGRLLASRPDLTLLVLLTTTAALMRLLLQTQAPAFGHNDTNGYLEPTYDLVVNQELTSSFKRPVGYPLLLATVFTSFGPSLMAVTAVQHLLGVCTVALTYLLGRQCCNRWVGLGAGLLVALSGPQLVYEHTIMPESLMILLVTALALLLIQVAHGNSHRPVFLAGCLLGLAILVKPVGQTLVPVALLWAGFRPGTRRDRLWSVGVLAFALALTAGPWAFRNLAVHGRFGVGGSAGDSLLARTAAYSRGQFTFVESDSSKSDPTKLAASRIIQTGMESRFSETQIRRQLRTELGLTDVQLDPVLQQLTIEAIRRQPLTFLRSIPESVHRIYGRREPESSSGLWQPRRFIDDRDKASWLLNRPAPTQELERSRVEALLSIYQPASFGMILPLLALLGLVRVRWTRPTSPIVVPAVLAFVLLMAHVILNGPVTRYRYVIEPLLNVLLLSSIWTTVRVLVGRLNARPRTGMREWLLVWRPATNSAGGRPDTA